MGYNSAIALASDIPDLPKSILDESLKKLEEYDSVIGPSIDGGYYLIGLRKDAIEENMFQGITWSTGSVFAETMKKKIKDKKISCHQLTPWHDIDLVEDLKRLKYSKESTFHRSHTWKYLKDSRITFDTV